MIKYRLNEKRVLSVAQDEDIYYGDNKITKIGLILPDKIDDYNVSECTFELVAELELGWRISYNLPWDNPVVDITTDLTDKVQTIDFRVIIRHNGDVIGKTNTKSKQVLPTKEEYKDLDPRGELDEIIRDLREQVADLEQDKADLEDEVEAKDQTITEKDNEIGVLSTEVNTLTGEVAEQAATITRQNTTIDELNARREPVYIEPQLVPKLITPSLASQYEEPPEGKDGFSAITVNPITADLIPNLEPQNVAKNKTILGVTGTFDSFPENPVGGIYFYDPDENDNPTKCKVYQYNSSDERFVGLFSDNRFPTIKKVEFVDSNITAFNNNDFRLDESVEQIILPDSLLTIGTDVFRSCYSLNNLRIPHGVLTIGSVAFQYCRGLTDFFLPNTIVSLGTSWNAGAPMSRAVLENGFNCSITLNSTAATHDTILSWFNALADRSGETAYTLTIGATNIAKMTAEEIAIATNKNWNIA